MENTEITFEGWAILEIMGHRRLSGYLSEQQIASTKMLRINIPTSDPDKSITQFYNPNSIYCISPCDEKIARGFAMNNQPKPVEKWELPALESNKKIKDYDEDVSEMIDVDDDYDDIMMT